MKTLSKIKLNQFSKAELDQRRMNELRGGGGCCCECDCSCACGCAADYLARSLTDVNMDSAGNSNSRADMHIDDVYGNGYY